MTLEDAILHCEEVAKRCKNDTDWGMGNIFIDRSGVEDIMECGQEHRQLAEWLRELKRLKEQPEPCEDTVSRQAVLEELRTCFDTESFEDEVNGGSYISYEDAVGAVEELPSVTTKRKSGKWERHYSRPGVYADLFWYCSECGGKQGYQWANMFKHCPECGADMREDGGEE